MLRRNVRRKCTTFFGAIGLICLRHSSERTATEHLPSPSAFTFIAITVHLASGNFQLDLTLIFDSVAAITRHVRISDNKLWWLLLFPNVRIQPVMPVIRAGIHPKPVQALASWRQSVPQLVRPMAGFVRVQLVLRGTLLAKQSRSCRRTRPFSPPSQTF